MRSSAGEDHGGSAAEAPKGGEHAAAAAVSETSVERHVRHLLRVRVATSSTMVMVVAPVALPRRGGASAA